MTSVSAAVVARPLSFSTQLLRPGAASSSATQNANIEALQQLKERMTAATGKSTAASPAPSSSAPTQPPMSLTWLSFQRTLPPSANSSSSPEVQALKSAFGAYVDSVSALVDDERSGAALADTAGLIYRVCMQLETKEAAATQAAQAAAASTSSGADSFAVAAPPSAELLTKLKALQAAAKTEVQQRIGRFGDVAWRQCQTLAREVRKQAADMQTKYEKTKLLRELSKAGAAANAAAEPDSSGNLFLPAPRVDAGPMEPLLATEFGAALPLPFAEDDEPVIEADEDEVAMGDLFGDSDEQPQKQQAQRGRGRSTGRAALQLLHERMRSMGLTLPVDQPVAPAAVPGSGSVLGMAPGQGLASSPSILWDDDSGSDTEDVSADESSEDESVRQSVQLSTLKSQPVRSMHDEPKPSPFTIASLPDGELPSNPAQWWSYLVHVCESLVTYSDAGVPMVSGLEIAQQLLGILQSSKADVQSELLDLIGYDCMELLGQLLQYRSEIKKITSQHQALARQSKAERAKAEAEATRKAKDGSVIRGLVGISIQSSADIAAFKNRKRADRRHARRSARSGAGDGVDKTFIDEAKLDAQANSLKHLISANAGQSVSQLPVGSTRVQHKGYEEVSIPPAPRVAIVESDLRLISESFEPFFRQAFPRMKTLNRIQSKVYESAYHSNGNLLISAPTGAGKTNIAMMCILRAIGQHIDNGVLRKDQFKMVYVAPMKALAAEMASAFQQRLAPLGMLVKELTGDMQLTKKELDETQLLVVTPEKWDVVTRKNHDGGSSGSGLMSLIKLLIIDEVHLLNEDRGPVLEILVARTLRLVESSQQMCRIVGLSATLPNYQDVAVFLRVNPSTGLHYFDASYRPVPLSQTFCGVTERNQMLRLQSMNDLAYKKATEAVKQSQQVMIFVHSRRDTVKTAKALRDAAMKDQQIALFDMSADPQYATFEKKFARSRNTDINELFRYGFSTHHAGMVRGDRSLVESAFAAGLIKVLVCTATLAWGVNLPAHTVIIKGTQIYDAEKGGFQDLGMLDIQQIFGRAGRPQFVDDCGHAIMICEHEKLNKYLSLLTHALPIESQFVKELPNHLNAEIILGTVSTLHEAVQWLSYTYLYTRMLRNPMAYGIKYDDMQYDELLVQQRTQLIIEAAKLLMRCRMVKFDQRTGQFYSTDVGRVASHYYLHFESIELYNNLLQPNMSDEDVLHLLASSKEFAQIKTRDEEMLELEKLAKKYAPIPIKGGRDGPTGKQNLLLQCYISNAIIDTPTLISDSYFIQQSAGRICRALFEMVLKRGRAFLAAKFLTFAQMIEHKIWHSQTPLRQFLVNANASLSSQRSGEEPRGGLMKMPAIMRLEERQLSLDELVDMSASEIGRVLKHDTLGHTVKQCLGYIPFLSVEAKIQPITRSVLRIDMELVAEFEWNDKHHGQAEAFWVWIEDTSNEHIYHSEAFVLQKRQMHDVHKLTFTIPIQEPLPPQYTICIKSDRWLGSDNVHTLSFKHLILPELHPNFTTLLNLPPLPRAALRNPAFEALYSFDYFNPIQTQIFHTLYHSDENVLLGAPTGSGKTVVAELAMLRLFSVYPKSKVVYIAPLKALARERIEDWCSAKSFKGVLGKKIVELTGDTAPDQRALLEGDILITTPEKWDGISRQWSTRGYVRAVGLVVIDEIHLLGADRGPVLEVIVSRMRYISSHTATPIRIVGLSTALSNARDLGDWLGIEKAGLFNFPASVRPVPLTIHIAGFAGKHYCPRMATMNKPTYAAIMQHSPTKPVLVFVSSRRQTRLTALDLIALSAAEGNPRKFLNMSDATLQQALALVSDPNLKNTLSFGIGMHSAGLSARDRAVVEKLFLERKIQVLVCTSTLAWGVNFPAYLVVVKGTEFYDAKVKRYVPFPLVDVLQMIGRAGRPQFDTEARAVVLVHEPLKSYYLNFLHSPFPVESSLLSQLHDHVNAEICSSGTIRSVGDFLDYLSWTFLFRRLLLNPSYYGLQATDSETLQAFLANLVRGVLGDLERTGLIAHESETGVLRALPLGKIASAYYLKYTTMSVFSEMLSPEASVERLLEVLANAREFEELPVRHNEDKMNAELSRGVRWPVNARAFDSAHTKTHLLLQAHLERLSLPVSDYYTDLKSVLDQTIRVLQAMVDTLCEAGWLAAALHCMTLMQMVVQGRWADDSPLANLPGTAPGSKAAAALAAEGLAIMPKLVTADRNRVAQVLRKGQASEKEVEQFLEAVARLPNVAMQIGRVNSAPASAAAAARAPAAQSHVLPLSSGAALPLAGGSTLNLQVSLHRRNANSNTRIMTPVFSKPKDEAWWVMVGLSSGNQGQQQQQQQGGKRGGGGLRLPSPQDELVAMRRVNSLRTRSNINLALPLPHAHGEHTYTVYLVSDSYLGFDQQSSFKVTIGGPTGATLQKTLQQHPDSAAAADDPDDIYN